MLFLRHWKRVSACQQEEKRQKRNRIRRFDFPKQIKHDAAQNNRHEQKIIRQDRAAAELAHQIAYGQQQHRQPKTLAVILDCKAFSANQMLIRPTVSLHLIEAAAHLKPAVSPRNRHLFEPQLRRSLCAQTLIVFDGFRLGHRTFFIVRQRQGKFVIRFIVYALAVRTHHEPVCQRIIRMGNRAKRLLAAMRHGHLRARCNGKQQHKRRRTRCKLPHMPCFLPQLGQDIKEPADQKRQHRKHCCRANLIAYDRNKCANTAEQQFSFSIFRLIQAHAEIKQQHGKRDAQRIGIYPECHNIKDRIADKQHQHFNCGCATADAARNQAGKDTADHQTHGVEHIHGLIQIRRAKRVHPAEKLNKKQGQQIIIAVL